jgi:DNA repair exonuclease SbcCD ATPase subunit
MMKTKPARKIKPRRKRRSKKWVPKLSKEETQRKIIDLYKEGAPYPTIASETHTSPKTIKEVIDSYEKSQVPHEESKRSAALRLLKNKDNSRLSVAMLLDLTSEQVETYQLELMRLEGLDDFVKAYDEVKESLLAFVAFYKSIRPRGLTLDEVYELKMIADQSENINDRYQRISVNLHKTEDALKEKLNLVKELDSQESLLQSSIAEMSKQLKALKKEESGLQSLVDYLKSEDASQEVIKIIQDEMAKILDSNNNLLAYASVSTMIALTKDPSLYEMLDPYSSQFHDRSLAEERLTNIAEPILFRLRSKIEQDVRDNILDELIRRAEERSL